MYYKARTEYTDSLGARTAKILNFQLTNQNLSDRKDSKRKRPKIYIKMMVFPGCLLSSKKRNKKLRRKMR
jgi:predicted transcriptional regulator